MKKILAIVMATVMMIGFSFMITGCGSQEEEEPATEATEATTEAAAVTDVDSLVGNYEDSTSQRATMTIVKDDDSDELEIKVSWSDSADQTTEWEMDAVLQDGKLVYTECEKEVKTFDENGAVISEEEFEEGSGYFEIGEDGKLLWTGAADSTCQECVFEKVTE